MVFASHIIAPRSAVFRGRLRISAMQHVTDCANVAAGSAVGGEGSGAPGEGGGRWAAVLPYTSGQR